MEKGSKYWNRQNQTTDTHKVEFFLKISHVLNLQQIL